MLAMDGKRILYRRKLCIPRNAIYIELNMAQDSRSNGHLKFAKTIVRINNFHGSHKLRYMKKYIDGCIICQKYKQSEQKKLWEPVSSKYHRESRVYWPLNSSFI